MSEPKPSIHDIADTAWWTAAYRARESERTDALFRDPFARRLAGDRGGDISVSIESQNKSEWSMVARTFLFDQLILEQVARGADMVVNLAAGLDARPYRMALPPSLIWVEVDLPDPLAYKESILKDERPVCALERVSIDLANVNARRELFDHLGKKATTPLIVSEGLLAYLTAEDAGLLARDLAQPPNFQRWILDVVSPGLLRLMQKQFGAQLARTGAGLRFGPEEGPAFFERYGWRASDVRSLLKTGARAKRVSVWMRALAMLPEPVNRQGSWPWSGVCLMEKVQQP
jgi:methyltransferase (TIGR00027 family)